MFFNKNVFNVFSVLRHGNEQYINHLQSQSENNAKYSKKRSKR